MPVPAPVAVSLLIAGGIAALELLGWAALLQPYFVLLPFRGRLDSLPKVSNPAELEDFAGNGTYTTWRWHAASRSLLFRRRVELGRRPYCSGRLVLKQDGSWELRWAPFPFFAWAAGVAAFFAYLFGLGYPSGFVLPGSVVLLLVVAANLWLSRRAFVGKVWPELRSELSRWLA